MVIQFEMLTTNTVIFQIFHHSFSPHLQYFASFSHCYNVPDP